MTACIGCDSSPDSGAVGASTASTAFEVTDVNSFELAVCRAKCLNMQACYESYAYSDPSVCAQLRCAEKPPMVQEAAELSAALLTLDLAQAKECAAGMAAAAGYCYPASLTVTAARACASVFRGALAVGAPCKSSRHCQSGVCSVADQGCGVCEAGAAPGQSCASAKCAWPAACVEGVCGGSVLDEIGAAGEGQACGGKSKLCGVGLWCDLGQGAQVCRKVPQLGEACSGNQACASGLGCKPTPDGASGTCSALGNAGAACWKGSPSFAKHNAGPSSGCLPGLVCVPAPASGGQLVCMAGKKPGEKAQVLAQCPFAQAWFVGDQAGGTCVPFGMPGQPCDEDGAAAPPLCDSRFGFCDKKIGKCVAFAGAGASCASTECAPPHGCDSASQTCRAWKVSVGCP